MAEQGTRHLTEAIDTVMQLTKAEFAILVAGFNAGAATMGARAADRDMAPVNTVRQLRRYLDAAHHGADGSVEVRLSLHAMLVLEWCWWRGCVKVEGEDEETKSVRFKLAQKTPLQTEACGDIGI